jgi:hypothetical protein
MDWRIYYVDGSTFGSDEGEPQDAPGGGVAAIAQRDDDVGVQIHHQRDFYVYGEEFGGWAGMDVFGLTQYLMRPGCKVVKLAEFMTTDGYNALINRLRDDPGLPTKSARYSWEAPF